MPVCLCVCTSLTFKRGRKRASERNNMAKLEREHSGSEGECVYLFCDVSAGNLASLPPPGYFSCNYCSTHCRERYNGSGVGVGVAWTVVENMADEKWNLLWSGAVEGNSWPFLGSHALFKRFTRLGMQEWEQRNREWELMCRWMHMHISVEWRSKQKTIWLQWLLIHDFLS